MCVDVKSEIGVSGDRLKIEVSSPPKKSEVLVVDFQCFGEWHHRNGEMGTQEDTGGQAQCPRRVAVLCAWKGFDSGTTIRN